MNAREQERSQDQHQGGASNAVEGDLLLEIMELERDVKSVKGLVVLSDSLASKRFDSNLITYRACEGLGI